MIKIELTAQEAPQRVDRFLLKYLNQATKTVVFRLIRKNIVRVNGKRIKENHKLQIGDVLALYLSDDSFRELRKEPKRVSPQKANLDIVHEDDEILIVNKPTGLLTHPDAMEYKNTLATRVQHYLSHLSGKTFTPAPIQRLDKNTSGLVLFAKTYSSLQHYNMLMRERKLGKRYLTIVEGVVSKAGTVQGYLTKDEKRNKVQLSSVETPGSKKVHTDFKPLEIKANHTLLEIDLKTGRSHQIRISLASIGHPILGDKKYGGKPYKNIYYQLLHAYKLIMPNGDTYEAPSQIIGTIWESIV